MKRLLIIALLGALVLPLSRHFRIDLPSLVSQVWSDFRADLQHDTNKLAASVEAAKNAGPGPDLAKIEREATEERLRRMEQALDAHEGR